MTLASPTPWEVPRPKFEMHTTVPRPACKPSWFVSLIVDIDVPEHFTLNGTSRLVASVALPTTSAKARPSATVFVAMGASFLEVGATLRDRFVHRRVDSN